MEDNIVAKIGENKIINSNCLEALRAIDDDAVHLTFFDPPFNQGKDYLHFDDEQPTEDYWKWVEDVLTLINKKSVNGASIYFMQREKNTEEVMKSLRKTGWVFQNLIIWKKMTSAVPSDIRYGKQFQIIVYATKDNKPRVFNKLRANVPLPKNYKTERRSGIFLTDVWDDIRELTSGYFAGDEAIRDKTGNRVHAQQSPLALLLRIILSSSLPGDTVLDPTAGTGVTAVVASQLKRSSISIEIDPNYAELIKNRLLSLRKADDITKIRNYYSPTEKLDNIWPFQRPLDNFLFDNQQVIA
ncbi:MAG: site-specific DNA-methyltransferase [Candidatus Thermoplasmatota archaeon]|jgi:DNA modification methylase|nr:site-specific DNA-methyltransferase [Candidatus Thermoplasmatota archaeon]MCL5987411.1 site-specific DNA-methyltransferase [Candidatus Thermoplasmatota archaeon]